MGNRRHTIKIQLYFSCPEKMEWISGFLDSTDRSDMSLVIWKRSWLSGNMAKHEIKFGKGWMGRGGEIQYVRHRYTGDLKGPLSQQGPLNVERARSTDVSFISSVQ